MVTPSKNKTPQRPPPYEVCPVQHQRRRVREVEAALQQQGVALQRAQGDAVLGVGGWVGWGGLAA
jgi:hypothetical protein